MKASRLSQKAHNWLGLAVGIQLLIWAVSGFYMVLINIQIIHGDHLVNRHTPPINLTSETQAALIELTTDHFKARSISVSATRGPITAFVEGAYAPTLYDLATLTPLPQVDELQAKQLALHYYANEAPISKVELIAKNPPSEIGGRALPLWRIDFDDAWGTSLYISPISGELKVKRHTLWRVFDIMWMLHIMDYEDRSDVTNTLLQIISGLTLLLVLTGFWYLYFRLKHSSQLNDATSGDKP